MSHQKRKSNSNGIQDTSDSKQNIGVEIFAEEPELEIPATGLVAENGDILVDPSTKINELVADAIFHLAPKFTLFSSDSGLLPNSIDITEDFKLSGDGSKAAHNLLSIADIKISELVNIDSRSRESKIARSLDKLNNDFTEFWNQKIGLKNKIKIEFSLEHYNNTNPEKSGKPYLLFWVSDGLNKLHPKQRSTGARWFISFYLQLKASQKLSSNLHFLLDEPGANLHSNAQHDVLKLINLLSKEIPITYSTHSPTLIEHDKLYRVYAVQRKNDDPEAPTEIIDAHCLGAASSDTLSPILTAIGTDLSHQNVIKKNNNVILEEISGFYYLTSFFKLLDIQKDIHFIAATGVNKIPVLANMFTGWGLNFSVTIDDDNQGRGVYKQLKKELFGDDEAKAQERIYKIKNCAGIEDIFSTNDFYKHVLNEALPADEKTPSEIVKLPQYSKPILAYSFALKVKNNEIKQEDLDPKTLEKITEVTSRIISTLH